MVAPDWYFAWVRTHCTAFSITNEDWIETLKSWRPAMIGLGATGPELAECTTRCLMDNPGPQFPSEHLAAVKRHLGTLKEARRAKDREAEQHAESSWGTCTYCDNGGLIAGMPYPKDVKGGEWVPHSRNHLGEPIYRTCAVFCSCPKGRRMHEETCAGKIAEQYGRPLALPDYERDVDPAWKEHIAERLAAELELVKAHSRANAAGAASAAGIGIPVGKGRR